MPTTLTILRLLRSICVGACLLWTVPAYAAEPTEFGPSSDLAGNVRTIYEDRDGNLFWEVTEKEEERMFVFLAVDSVLQTSLLVGLMVLSLWIYRRLRLPSIPWLVAYAILTIATGAIPQWLYIGILSSSPIITTPSAVTSIGLQPEVLLGILGLLSTLSHAVVAWFLVAEFTYVLSNSSLLSDLTVSKTAILPREHSTVFGIILLACGLAPSLRFLPS